MAENNKKQFTYNHIAGIKPKSFVFKNLKCTEIGKQIISIFLERQ